MLSTQNTIPEFLYHVKRTIINYHDDPSGATRITDILGTFTNLIAAKNAARSALASEGYLKDDFETYEQKDEEDEEQEWKHEDGVLIWAKAPAGQEFEVRLDTKPNLGAFKGNEHGEVEGVLHYVLQTSIDYNNNRIGGVQHTEVQGTYPTRRIAFEAAKTALLDDEITKESFADYDVKDDFVGEWPYGDDCWVHAVAENGENTSVYVKAQPLPPNHPKEKQHHGPRRGSKSSTRSKKEVKEAENV